MPFAAPIIQHGQSIKEQECYLAHDGDNKAIIDCLHTYRDEHAMETGWIFIVALLLVAIGLGGSTKKPGGL